jgi:WD40 repeat protein
VPKPVRSLTGHTDGVRALSFSPNGAMLASASNDRSIRLWEFSSGKELHKFAGHMGRVCCVSSSSDGRLLASGAEDGTARVWEVKSGDQLAQFTLKSRQVRLVAFSPDDKNVLVGLHSPAELSLWNIDQEKPVRSYAAQGQFLHSAGVSRDGLLVGAGGCFGSITVWDAATGRSLFSQQITTEAGISSVVFARDGSQLLLTGFEVPLQAWDVKSGRRTFALKETENSKPAQSPGWGFATAPSPDGKSAALLAVNEVYIHEIPSGKVIGHIYHGRDMAHAVAFSPDGRYLVTAGGGMRDGENFLPSYDNTIRTWDVQQAIEMTATAK